jgi:two-component system chemotaxis response regulator CheY
MAYNVLIVDDSSSIRSAVKKVIEISGFDVGEYFEAANGKDALSVLEENWADVILTDIHMPVMDGISFFTCYFCYNRRKRRGNRRKF